LVGSFNPLKVVMIKLLDVHSAKEETSELIPGGIQCSIQIYGITGKLSAFVVTTLTLILAGKFV
jgi:hypothetical protein